MKNISALAFTFEIKSNGIANFNTKPPFDTLQWVQNNIISNKQNFIGGNFTALLNTLPIPLKSYYTISPENTINSCTAIGVSFLPSFEADPDNYPPGMFLVTLIIVWQTPIPLSECVEIGKITKGNWTGSENQFYGNRIIADILLVDFTR